MLIAASQKCQTKLPVLPELNYTIKAGCLIPGSTSKTASAYHVPTSEEAVTPDRSRIAMLVSFAESDATTCEMVAAKIALRI